MWKKKSLLILVISFAPVLMMATIVTGNITDEKNTPLPFVSIYVKGTTKGTTSNSEGNYSLELANGEYELVFKIIGYKQQIEKVSATTPKIMLDISLQPEDIQLKEISITANGEDPAYAVIRQAIKKRKYYLTQVKSYSCDVYIKGIQRITQAPKKFLGQEIDFGGKRDSASGIVYLSESVSKFNFMQPDKIKEEMISSKVSGNNKAFSYNQASEMLFNFYENLIEVEVLSDRGFISPIASTALLTYKYKLLGTFYENGQQVNKIEVTPRQSTDPAFRGIIYIVENTWRIHSTDLYLTKETKIEFVDTIRVRQVHLPVGGSTKQDSTQVWMPFSNRFNFSFGFFGFKGNGMYTGVNSNYVIEPQLPKNFFDNEVLKITEEVNKKDSTYWNTIRPVPLTMEEEKDYQRRDSLLVLHESKAFKDSLDKKRNRFHFTDAIFGYTYYNRFNKRTITFSPLVNNVQFNTVQGWNLSQELTYTKRYEVRKHSLSVSIEGGYGFSNNRGYGKAGLTYRYKPQRYGNVRFSFGRSAEQLNGKKITSAIENVIYSSYALFDKENLLKLYEKDAIGLHHSIEVINGLVIIANTEYAYRRPLLNTTAYSFINKPEKPYTSNNPFEPLSNTTAFAANGTMETELGFRIRFKQKYYTLPHEKVIIGSKYPTITLQYKKAIKGVFGATTDYDLATVTVADEINLKIFGDLRYSLKAGKFLNDRTMSLPDYYHLKTSGTIFSSFSTASFNLPGLYQHSTNRYFAEAHVEEHFGGFIVNKLPLLRRIKIQEIIGYHFLVNERQQYSELSIGLQRLAFRVDFATGFTNNSKVSAGFRIGITF